MGQEQRGSWGGLASRLLQHPCSNITDMQNAHNKLTILLKFSNFNTHTYRKYEDPTLCGCCGELFLESSRGSLTRWVALPPQAQWRTISTCGYLGQQMLALGETHLGLNMLVWGWGWQDHCSAPMLVWPRQAGLCWRARSVQQALQLRPGSAWQPEEAGQESAQQADNTSD